MDENTLYDEATRRQAVALLDKGMDNEVAAGLLGIPGKARENGRASTGS